MPSKTAPRTSAAGIAAAFALSAFFNAAALAAPAPAAGPQGFRTDRHGIEVPVCKNDLGQDVDFYAEEHQYFADHKKYLVDSQPSMYGIDDIGPFVYYDYQELLKLKPAYRSHVLYRECILNAHGDYAQAPQIDTTKIDNQELRADCKTIQYLRHSRGYGRTKVNDIGWGIVGENPEVTPRIRARVINLFNCFVR
jgi:hypothetical protein